MRLAVTAILLLQAAGCRTREEVGTQSRHTGVLRELAAFDDWRSRVVGELNLDTSRLVKSAACERDDSKLPTGGICRVTVPSLTQPHRITYQLEWVKTDPGLTRAVIRGLELDPALDCAVLASRVVAMSPAKQECEPDTGGERATISLEANGTSVSWAAIGFIEREQNRDFAAR